MSEDMRFERRNALDWHAKWHFADDTDCVIIADTLASLGSDLLWLKKQLLLGLGGLVDDAMRKSQLGLRCIIVL